MASQIVGQGVPTVPKRRLVLMGLAALAFNAAGSVRASETAVITPDLAARAAPATNTRPVKKPRVPRSERAERSPSATSKGATSYATRAEAMQLAAEIATRHSIDPAWVNQVMARARFLTHVPKLVLPAPPGTPKNWKLYRSRFVEPIRINAGARFWQAHRATLERAEQTFGVPVEIIVGVIGVETLYGQHMGNVRVLDALATLAFDFPQEHPRAQQRSAFFRGELEAFIVLHHQQRSDPLLPMGSYAGAMGIPQFMPSSWTKFAVDFDGDGQINLFTSVADAIGSVGNYFKMFDWRPGMITHYPVRFDAQTVDMEALLAPDILPTFSVASFAAKGALLDGDANQHKGPLALVELQNGPDAPGYVAGTENFYAITRYNWSSYYAMAVIELGLEVAAVLRR